MFLLDFHLTSPFLFKSNTWRTSASNVMPVSSTELILFKTYTLHTCTITWSDTFAMFLQQLLCGKPQTLTNANMTGSIPIKAENDNGQNILKSVKLASTHCALWCFTPSTDKRLVTTIPIHSVIKVQYKVTDLQSLSSWAIRGCFIFSLF